MNSLRPGDMIGIDRSVLRRALATCLVVGTVLTAVNHGGTIMIGAFQAENSWQIAITFAVPFAVAVFASVTAVSRVPGRSLGPERLEMAVAAATFPDRNPNPVMRFATDGTLLYANPASAALADRLWPSVAESVPVGVLSRVLTSASIEPPEAVAIDTDGRSYLVRAIDVPEFGFVNVYATEIVREAVPTSSAA